MIILGIDTSCDETSASILKDGKILSNIVYAQHIHKSYGGVVPNLASKDHEKNILNTVCESLRVANIELKDISAISVTYAPGLITCLLVGLNFAKGLAVGLNIPLIPINHLDGHLCSNLINNETIDYPYICLLVSGGHTQLWEVLNASESNMLATTLDDAAGEAFDKGAKLLGLSYPGGPEIEKYSLNGDIYKYSFSIPKVKNNPLNFSFSGIKTSLYYLIKKMDKFHIDNNLNHLCASYQEGILNILFDRLNKIFENKNYDNVSVVGGVACNKRFRDKAKQFENKYKISFRFPQMQYCTDNGAMIATAAYLKMLEHDNLSRLDISPVPNLKF